MGRKEDNVTEETGLEQSLQLLNRIADWIFSSYDKVNQTNQCDGQIDNVIHSMGCGIG